MCYHIIENPQIVEMCFVRVHLGYKWVYYKANINRYVFATLYYYFLGLIGSETYEKTFGTSIITDNSVYGTTYTKGESSGIGTG